jgi:hypothetical protein
MDAGYTGVCWVRLFFTCFDHCKFDRQQRRKRTIMANPQVCSTDGACAWQTYANLLDYIKLNLGAKTSAFEFSDEDIIDIIKEHTLPEFSKYIPLIKYYRVTEEENLITENPTKLYQFKNFCYKIMKINNVIGTATLQDMDLLYLQAGRQSAWDVTEMLMAKNYSDMSMIAVPPQTWRFFPPDKIEIIKSHDALIINRDFIAELACIHDNPTTVNPDQYNLLRDLALADIMIYIGRIRTRYEQFTTPYGEVQVVSRAYIDEGTQLRERTLEALKNLPPDDFIFFLN